VGRDDGCCVVDCRSAEAETLSARDNQKPLLSTIIYLPPHQHQYARQTIYNTRNLKLL
jgi:hypothetical protein